MGGGCSSIVDTVTDPFSFNIAIMIHWASYSLRFSWLENLTRLQFVLEEDIEIGSQQAQGLQFDSWSHPSTLQQRQEGSSSRLGTHVLRKPDFYKYRVTDSTYISLFTLGF